MDYEGLQVDVWNMAVRARVTGCVSQNEAMLAFRK